MREDATQLMGRNGDVVDDDDDDDDDDDKYSNLIFKKKEGKMRTQEFSCFPIEKESLWICKSEKCVNAKSQGNGRRLLLEMTTQTGGQADKTQ